MHKTIFKYRFYYRTRTVNRRKISHERRLNIGRKTRIRQGLDIGRCMRSEIASDYHLLISDLDTHTAFAEFCNHRLQMIGYYIAYVQCSSGNSRRKHESSCLYPIGNDRMFCSMQLVHTFDFDRVRSRTFDFCAHFIQKVCQINDFGFFCGIFQICDAMCQNGSHHYVLRRSHTRKVEINRIAYQTLRSCCGFYISLLIVDGNDRSQSFQSFQVQVDRSCTDCTASRQRNLGSAFSGKQRSHYQNRCPHFVHKFKSRFCGYYILGLDG